MTFAVAVKNCRRRECVIIAVIHLSAVVCAYEKVPVLVLKHRVYEVMGESVRPVIATSVHSEFSSVISVEPIFSGYPYHSIGILKYIVDKAA